MLSKPVDVLMSQNSNLSPSFMLLISDLASYFRENRNNQENLHLSLLLTYLHQGLYYLRLPLLLLLAFHSKLTTLFADPDSMPLSLLQWSSNTLCNIFILTSHSLLDHLHWHHECAQVLPHPKESLLNSILAGYPVGINLLTFSAKHLRRVVSAH